MSICSPWHSVAVELVKSIYIASLLAGATRSNYLSLFWANSVFRPMPPARIFFAADTMIVKILLYFSKYYGENYHLRKTCVCYFIIHDGVYPGCQRQSSRNIVSFACFPYNPRL